MGEIGAHRGGIMERVGALVVVGRTCEAQVMSHRLIEHRLEGCPGGSAAAGAAVEQSGGASTGACLTDQHAVGRISIDGQVRYRTHRGGYKRVLIDWAREEFAYTKTALTAGWTLVQSVPPRFGAVGQVWSRSGRGATNRDRIGRVGGHANGLWTSVQAGGAGITGRVENSDSRGGGGLEKRVDTFDVRFVGLV